MVPCITRRILLARFLPSAYRTRPARFRSKPIETLPYQKFLFGDYSVSHRFLFVKLFLFIFVMFEHFIFIFSLIPVYSSFLIYPIHRYCICHFLVFFFGDFVPFEKRSYYAFFELLVRFHFLCFAYNNRQKALEEGDGYG